jgi:hypothetical protein
VNRNIAGRITVLLVMSGIAFAAFARSPGAEAVRNVQILLLFASGMCAGVALTLFRVSRSS